MLRLMDDFPHPNILVWLEHLDRLSQCDEILQWLIQHQFTGKKFLEFVMVGHKNSILEAAKHVIRRIRRDAEVRPIVAGKDYRVGPSVGGGGPLPLFPLKKPSMLK